MVYETLWTYYLSFLNMSLLKQFYMAEHIEQITKTCSASKWLSRFCFCWTSNFSTHLKSLEFRQASNHWKRVLEAAKLAVFSLKQTSPSLPRNLAFRTFGKLLIVFSTKVNLLVAPRCGLLHLIKQNCLLKTFLITLILMMGISLSVFPSRTNPKLHNISITTKMVEKVIMNLIHQRQLVLILFQWSWF